jgi:hypothetical protein
MSKEKDTETKIIRLQAYVGALEGLLLAIVDNLPNKQEVISQFAAEAKTYDDMALAENFSDEEIEATQYCHKAVLTLLTKG